MTTRYFFPRNLRYVITHVHSCFFFSSSIPNSFSRKWIAPLIATLLSINAESVIFLYAIYFVILFHGLLSASWVFNPTRFCGNELWVATRHSFDSELDSSSQAAKTTVRPEIGRTGDAVEHDATGSEIQEGGPQNMVRQTTPFRECSFLRWSRVELTEPRLFDRQCSPETRYNEELDLPGNLADRQTSPSARQLRHNTGIRDCSITPLLR